MYSNLGMSQCWLQGLLPMIVLLCNRRRDHKFYWASHDDPRQFDAVYMISENDRGHQGDIAGLHPCLNLSRGEEYMGLIYSILYLLCVDQYILLFNEWPLEQQQCPASWTGNIGNPLGPPRFIKPCGSRANLSETQESHILSSTRVDKIL